VKTNNSTGELNEDVEKNIFIKKVEEGMAQIKSKQTFTHQQVKQKVKNWTSDETKSTN